MIPLFDLHCDTLLELYKKKEKIEENSLHISLKKVQNFSKYIQIGAIWSDYRLTDDEAYSRCLDVINYAQSQKIDFSVNLNNSNKYNLILGIEDSRLLGDKLNRLDILYSCGVRVLTLNWKDNSRIGGAWNTTVPLSDFGKNVVFHAYELGIIIDVSHSSVETFWDVVSLSERLGFSPIASHSNSFSICNHKRNLNDEQIKKICELKGLIGISLVPEHLGGSFSLDSIIRHIDYFLTLGCLNTLCLGCDFDGTTTLPYEINSVEDLHLLYYKIESTFGKEIANKIFFENAFSFFEKNLWKGLYHVFIYDSRFTLILVC